MTIFFPPESEAEVSPSPPPPRPRGRRWVRRSLAVLAALVAVILVGSAIYVGVLNSTFTSNVHREPLLPTDDEPTGPSAGESTSPAPRRPAKRITGARNYVLMGSDTRDPSGENGRSDTLMVLHLASDRRSAYLISFPRDMYVSIPGYGKNKINAAYSFGGPKLAVATLEQLLDTRMDHVAIIDFDGFIGLTEDLGGVTVDNKHASKSRGYTFPAGKITIKGDEALAFVRERYDLPNGDLDRAERQRLVVRAILKKGLSPETIADPVTFTRFVSGVAEHLTIDDQLTNAEIRRTATSLRMTAEDVELLQAPISGFGEVNGASIDVVDTQRLAELAKALQDDTVDEYLKQHPGR